MDLSIFVIVLLCRQEQFSLILYIYTQKCLLLYASPYGMKQTLFVRMFGKLSPVDNGESCF